jgi:hypothetical protein
VATGDETIVAVDRPPFKLVFLTVTGLTVLTLGISVVLAVFIQHPDPSVANTIDATATIYKLGFGALAGLLGGKVS